MLQTSFWKMTSKTAVSKFVGFEMTVYLLKNNKNSLRFTKEFLKCYVLFISKQ